MDGKKRLKSKSCLQILAVKLPLLILHLVFSFSTLAAQLPATGQNRTVVIGEDGNPAIGLPRSFSDNKNGTVTDNNTGLVWEKKIKADQIRDADNLHDADNLYSWSGVCAKNQLACSTNADCGNAGVCQTGDGQTAFPNGMTVFQWLEAVNAEAGGLGFANVKRWRLPSMKELGSITNYGMASGKDRAFTGKRCGSACTDIADPDCSCSADMPNSKDSYWYASSPVHKNSEVWQEQAVRLTPVRAVYKDRSAQLIEDKPMRFAEAEHNVAFPLYTDNQDGTITDHYRGLMWEKKNNADGVGSVHNLHDADNRYPWGGSCSNNGAECGTRADCEKGAVCEAGDAQTPFPNGMTIFQWINAVNAKQQGSVNKTSVSDELKNQAFVGYQDWRIPNVEELRSIIDDKHSNPAVAPEFHGARCGIDCQEITKPECSCTAVSGAWFGVVDIEMLRHPVTPYWSSTTAAVPPIAAYFVDFKSGAVAIEHKQVFMFFVRAVRTK